MACCGGTNEGSKKNRELDRQIRIDRQRQEVEIKLLLLGSSSLHNTHISLIPSIRYSGETHVLFFVNKGAGESGKSTFAKQMKILHMAGFDDTERSSFRTIIRKNILHSFETILKACDQIGISVQSENEVYALNHFFPSPTTHANQTQHLAMKYSKGGIDSFTSSDVDDIKTLWNDTGVQEAVSRANEFQYFDSTG
jgi:hypothetical protein